MTRICNRANRKSIHLEAAIPLILRPPIPYIRTCADRDDIRGRRDKPLITYHSCPLIDHGVELCEVNAKLIETIIRYFIGMRISPHRVYFIKH